MESIYIAPFIEKVGNISACEGESTALQTFKNSLLQANMHSYSENMSITLPCKVFFIYPTCNFRDSKNNHLKNKNVGSFWS